MLNNITIAAKAELKDETIVKLAEGQKEIELAKIAAVVTVASTALEFLILTQRARIAEAGARSAEAEIAVTEAKARIAEAEALRASAEVEKAKYAAEADAEFLKASSAKKKPYVNGTTAVGVE